MLSSIANLCFPCIATLPDLLYLQDTMAQVKVRLAFAILWLPHSPSNANDTDNAHAIVDSHVAG